MCVRVCGFFHLALYFGGLYMPHRVVYSFLIAELYDIALI